MLSTIRHWLHPKSRNRIALDYPLDCLLNRSCRLSDYEHGAFPELRRYNSCVYAILSLLRDNRPDLTKWQRKLEEALARANRHFESSVTEPAPNEFDAYFKIDSLPYRLRPHWGLLQESWHRLNQYSGSLGALQLPLDDHLDPLENEPKGGQENAPNCSGNILIRGRPGTGKSTLAMQMALAATSRPNHYGALLLAMEEDREHVLRKAHSLGLGGNMRRLQHLGFLDESSDSLQLAKSLAFALSRPGDCPLDAGREKTPVLGASAPCVLLPRLSPRSIRMVGSPGADLFWERFGQLERLLHAIKELRGMPDMPNIRMVCIDGLGAFGERAPTRDEIAKLFELFQRNGVIGVVTSEEETSSGSSAASDALEYLADIVINLTMEEDRGYSVRYLEVVKSRYHHEVYGKHFVRLRGSEILSQQRAKWTSPEATERLGLIAEKLATDMPCPPSFFRSSQLEELVEPISTAKEHVLFDQDAVTAACEQLIEEHNWRCLCYPPAHSSRRLELETIQALLKRCNPLLQTLMVQPSVHYVVGATESDVIGDEDEDEDENEDTQHLPAATTETGPSSTKGPVPAPSDKADERFSLGESNLDLIIKYRLPRGRVVTIKGPPGTYKSIIAKNFIFHGVGRGETVLYIGLAENTTFSPKDWESSLVSQATRDLRLDFKTFRPVHCRGLDDAKRRMRVWQSPSSDGRKCRLYDLAVKGGALLPEEMLEFVRDILRQEVSEVSFGSGGDGRRRWLKRVVLDDVALIGTSYPFLRDSRTAGDLFLPAFVHLMRNYGVDLLLVGTTGQLVEGDRMVDRASLLADTVLTTSHTNVFGDRYVTVTGEGLAHAGMQEGERDQIGMFEYSPGVVCADPSHKNAFEVNLDLLKGLVGFGTDKVSRPKLMIQIPDQPGDIYDAYKEDVMALIHDAMGSEGPSAVGIQGTPGTGDPAVADSRAPSRIADPVHSPLEVLEGKPLEHTVVCMLDEFWKSGHLRPALSLANLKRYFLDDQKDPKAAAPPKEKKNELPWRKSEFIISPYFSDTAAKGLKPAANDSDESPYAVPFYGNVLLVAYHEDVLKKSPPQSKLPSGAKRTSWRRLCALARTHGFDCDTTAKETLACLLLDALLAAARTTRSYRSLTNWEERQNPSTIKNLRQTDDDVGSCLRKKLFSALDPKGEAYNPDLLDGFVSNMIHVAELLDMAKGHSNAVDRRKYILNYEAKIFVCWYSQLRELIASSQAPALQPPSANAETVTREKLASKMRICAMPGGGFRGDWYLAVAKGSVSLDLGVRAVEILTRRPQEYDRFARGLGLPVRDDFREKTKSRNFFAWPHAKATAGNTAEDLFKVHRAAYSRASIPDYTHFRRMLAIMVDEVLLAYREHKRKKRRGSPTRDQRLRNAVLKILIRLPHQIDLLVGRSEDADVTAPNRAAAQSRSTPPAALA